MPYLITGACGNLGRYVVSRFLSLGYEVIGIDIKTSETIKAFTYLEKIAKSTHKTFTMHWLDASNIAALERIFSDNQYKLAGIIHLAFIIPPFSEMHPTKTHSIHINMMNNLISLTEKYCPRIPFVFCSSTTVFSPPDTPTQIIDTTHPIKGNSQYTKDKIECENLLKQSSLAWKILRLSVIMNPTFRPKKESIEYGLAISLDTLVEPVHVCDVATAILHAATSLDNSHKIFIIAGGGKNRMTYQDYIFGMLRAMIKDLTLNDVPWNLFTGQKKNYLHWYDTQESETLLKFQQKTFFDYCTDIQNEFYWWEKVAAFLLGKKLINKYFGN